MKKNLAIPCLLFAAFNLFASAAQAVRVNQAAEPAPSRKTVLLGPACDPDSMQTSPAGVSNGTVGAYRYSGTRPGAKLVENEKVDSILTRNKTLSAFYWTDKDISLFHIKSGVETKLPENIPPLPVIDLPVSLTTEEHSPIKERADYSHGRSEEELHVILYKSKLDSEDIAKAEKIYAAGANFHSRSLRQSMAEIYANYASDLKKNKKLVEAIKFYRSALYLEPDTATNSVALDACLQESGFDARNLSVRRQIGNRAKEMGDYLTAATEFRACMNLGTNPEDQVLFGETLIAGGQLVRGYAQVLLGLENPNWAAEDIAKIGKYHEHLADILYEYAIKARDSGRGTKGMLRLLNCWHEYVEALRFLPEDKEIRQKLMLVAKMAVQIRPNACNNLALASANILNGQKDEANVLLENVRKLDPTYSGLERAEQLAAGL